ncbi:MAG: AAA family ATPase, partial [Verrucomicrobiota bacterium]
IKESEAQIQPLEEEIKKQNEALEAIRAKRQARTSALAESEESLRQKRDQLDRLRTARSSIDVKLAEHRMRKQNLIDRVVADYRITEDDIITADEPEWENESKPDRETLETRVAELKTKLESMGPVNLVAIEEHRELEERYTFLTQQEEDLQNAKKELMEMIRKINSTTTELFSKTFHQVNEHFQVIFKQLFGGGNAKLVLVDEDDVLESGIEIIARPPGKKLQTISLLSGGERTMTAVALLFSLYSVKPSPFCLLDELDAALDDANINRFVTMLQGFLEQSQFVVITHNRQTIEAADVLYGVTMQQKGVSKIVSVKLHDHAKSEDAKPQPQAT